MAAIDEALARLRRRAPAVAGPIGDELRSNGIGFAAVGGPLQARWDQAVLELSACVGALQDGGPAVLSEGGVYRGSWIESTGTISAEVLTRFAPVVARETFLQFARHQRDDGLIPYKVTADGEAFTQIQIVTPLARSVWNHYVLAGRDRGFLATMYAAMSSNDAWLAAHRDTRGSGAVEAFCTFDTGHDLSPRFWFAPDRCYRGDAAQVDPASPLLPYIAPDLTANVACQRAYLAVIAEELGDDPEPWRLKAEASLAALWQECWDATDETFYDRARNGAPVRIVSDVLLRVLACEVGDDEVFGRALDRYLMDTGKFLAHYGFTSLAMDDPRFDPDFQRNSWGGPVNFLSLIRAPHAFESHGRIAELGVASMPVLGAVARADRFPQCLDPWSGAPGFTEVYSPSILWFLDAIERWTGILPRPDGSVWFTGLTPTRLDHGGAASAVASARLIDGVRYELAADDDVVVVLRGGMPHLRFPRGWRVVADHTGEPNGIVCVAGGAVGGRLQHTAGAVELTLAPNERVDLRGLDVTGRTTPGFVAPHI
jgi:hypothetical protein